METYNRTDFKIKNTVLTEKRQSQKGCGGRRRGNGRGTVEYTKNRRNPYKAKVPMGTYIDKRGKVQVQYKSLGSFPSKGLAEEALSEYERTPYDLMSKIKTFNDLYEAWSREYFLMVGSESSIRTVTSAYAYCSELYHMPIRQIRCGHIKDAMNRGYIIVASGKHMGEKKYASDCTKERIKSMCNLMFDYATEHGLVASNPARAFKIKKLLQTIAENAKEKQPFSAEQVNLLWQYYERIPFADMVLIGIYTAFRPQELATIRIEKVSMEENYIIAGMKTQNGIDRLVPIHPAIKKLVEYRYHQAKEIFCSEYLFNVPKGKGFSPMNYDTYRTRFNHVMAEMNLAGFSPHCTRHTFATQAEVCQLRERAIKMIMGHSLNTDVTDKHYKHTGYEYLYEEICKLSFDGRDV